MNLKQIIQWYTSIEALSYLTTMLFGIAIGFGLFAMLLTYTTNSFELMKLLLIIDSWLSIKKLAEFDGWTNKRNSKRVICKIDFTLNLSKRNLNE